MAHKGHYHYRRGRNPFGAGRVQPLVTKVAGALAGGIGAAAIPAAVPTFNSGWMGVLAAGGIAFVGAWLTKGMPDFSEGVLIGGLLQAAGRIGGLLVGKNFVSFGLSGYGPMRFPVPTPAYSMPGGQAVPMIPASGAIAKSPAAAPGVRTMGKSYYKFAA